MKHIPIGSNYVPAIGDNLITIWQEDRRRNDKGFRFFDKGNSFFDHNFLLCSAYYRINQNDFDHRRTINYPDDTIIIGDSGGFQVMTFGKKGKEISVTPLQVLRWLENNVDIGMNLDVPPVSNFNDALRKSCENFSLFENNRTNYDMSLYNILHGRNLSQITEWYDNVKSFDFDGWAIGVHPSTNIYLKLIAYLYLLSKGDNDILTNCHFFGVSGPSNMISTAILSKYCDSALTFDSSSWSWGQRFRDYWFPLDIRHCIRLGRDFKNSMTSICCDCPVCSTMSISELYDQNNPMTPLLLSYHNLYQYIEVNRIINILSDDEETLRIYARSINEEQLFDNIISILDDYFKNNKSIEFIYNKYLHLFRKVPMQDSQQNLFKFDQ